MTVSSSTAKVSYAGNGSTTVFAVTFRFLANSHVVATLRDANGAETTWVENTNYTLSGAGAASGTLTATVAPASGETLVITRDVPRTQETDYGENDSFPAETHEQALDKLTMLAQQVDETVARAFVVPISDTAPSLEMPIDSLRASKFLAFDATGRPIAAAGTTSDFQPVSAFIDTLLDDADAATARTTLGAVGLSGNETIAGNKTLSGQTTLSALLTLSAALNSAKATNVASAASPNIWVTDGNLVHITGTTTITDFADAPQAGASRVVIFDGALTLTHNASQIVLPGAANITTAAGDMMIVFADSTSLFKVMYFPVSGRPVGGGLIPGTQLSLNPYAPNTTTVQAHGLGAVPDVVITELVAVNAVQGYSVGDRIEVSSLGLVNPEGAQQAVALEKDATNVRLHLSTNLPQTVNKSTRAVFTITAADWRVTCTPYLN